MLSPLFRPFFALFDRLLGWRDRLPGIGALTLSRVLATVSVLVMAGIILRDLIAPTPAISSVEPAAPRRPSWSEVTRAHGAFALSHPALDPLEFRYLVRRHREGGGRKDSLTWGGLDKPGPYVRVALYRPGTEGRPIVEPLAAVAAAAADAAVEAKLSVAAGELTTKFGALDLVDLTIRSSAGPRRCLAMTGAWDDPDFGMVAWWCGNGEEIVPQGQLACLLDRLVLMAAGGDERLAELFAQAERERTFCGTPRAVVNATPKRADDWVSAKREPKLRGRITSR